MKKNFTINISEEILCNAETLFYLASDYSKRLEWDPFMKRMEFLDGATTMQKGGLTRTHTHYGLTMDTVFIQYQPPEVIAMDMVRGPFFFRHFAGTWRFGKIGEGKSRASFIYSFSFVFPFHWALGPLVLWRLRTEMERRMQCLKLAAEKYEIKP
jgi:ribosome-associated toxin RatA of RatAB toxin-antitoxin module